MGLRLKFNLVMLVAFVIGLGLAGVLSYGMVTTNARREVLNDAAIMSGQADAISSYTANEIAPLLVSQFDHRFLPQSVPAWSAQTNFRTLQKSFPEYSYRTVMTNPTNPADLPDDWQAGIIKQLLQEPSTKEIVSERNTPNGRILSISRPIIITNQACLQCHSVPANAPQTMIDLYGPDRGFNWKLNEVLGAQIVSVPMALPLGRAQETFITIMTGLTGVFVVMVLLLNLMLHYVIIRPVRQIANAATAVSLGNMDAPEYVVRGKDEISSLAEAFNRMRRSMANALRMLEE